jgi:putative two-component system response regulator
MPGMDGFEVCRQLKQDAGTCNIPIIFVTAMGEETDERTGLELGAVDYITKPISPAITLARVRTHLALADHSRALARLVEDRTYELFTTRQQIIQRLGRAAEYKDNETGDHILRMSHYTRLLAEAAGLETARSDVLFQAAPMHDVGKIGIPDGILLKPGKLDDAEWKVMRRHPELGADIIGEHSDPLLYTARIIAWTHHEKWDGTGYPRRLVGEAIPLEGRIVAVADVFDALASERPYKKAWKIDEVVHFMNSQSGKHFDPRLIELLPKVLPEFLSYSTRFASDGYMTQNSVLLRL